MSLGLPFVILPELFDRPASDNHHHRHHYRAMADEVPAALKAADVSLYKTATRGAQLQSVKPIISYWCMFCCKSL